ncbi:MAG: hypothetical protein QXY39_05660 [Thermofilaceae archaeon]
MSVPIIKQYNSLSGEIRNKIDELINKCDIIGLINILSEALNRKVSEREVRYLVLELNPNCARSGDIKIDINKYYKEVDIAKELDFIYNVEKERLIVSRQLEIDSGNVPLSITDKIVEVLVKIIELRAKKVPHIDTVDELRKLLEEDERDV